MSYPTGLRMDDGKQEFLIALGAHIRKVREEQGISGAELARRCHMDKQNIHRLEKGEFSPTVWYLSKICKGLDITISQLLNNYDI